MSSDNMNKSLAKIKKVYKPVLFVSIAHQSSLARIGIQSEDNYCLLAPTCPSPVFTSEFFCCSSSASLQEFLP